MMNDYKKAWSAFLVLAVCSLLVAYLSSYFVLRATHQFVHCKVMHNSGENWGTHYFDTSPSIDDQGRIASLFYPLLVGEVYVWYKVDPVKDDGLRYSLVFSANNNDAGHPH